LQGKAVNRNNLTELKAPDSVKVSGACLFLNN
jgi:hypothetical protein